MHNISISTFTNATWSSRAGCCTWCTYGLILQVPWLCHWHDRKATCTAIFIQLVCARWVSKILYEFRFIQFNLLIWCFTTVSSYECCCSSLIRCPYTDLQYVYGTDTAGSCTWIGNSVATVTTDVFWENWIIKPGKLAKIVRIFKNIEHIKNHGVIFWPERIWPVFPMLWSGHAWNFVTDLMTAS